MDPVLLRQRRGDVKTVQSDDENDMDDVPRLGNQLLNNNNIYSYSYINPLKSLFPR